MGLKKILSFAFFFLLMCLGTVQAGSFYWVGGSGNWNDSQHWSSASGGKGGAGIPSNQDNVIFDIHSFLQKGSVVTINGTAVCKDFQIKIEAGASILKGVAGSKLEISGSLDWKGNTKNELEGDIYFKSIQKGNTIDFDVKHPRGNIYFDGGGSWNLKNYLLLNEGKNIYLNAATLNTNDYPVRAAAIIEKSGVSHKINAGASWVVLSKQTLTAATASGIKNLRIQSLDKAGSANKAQTIVATTHTVVNVTCPGGSDGSVTLSVTGDGPTFTYDWSAGTPNTLPGGVSSGFFPSVPTNSQPAVVTVSGFQKGNFTIVITDEAPAPNDDQVIYFVAVDGPNAWASIFSPNTAPTCSYLCDGSIRSIVGGGTSPYTYSWSTAPAQTASIASNLCPGTYTVTITDSRSCSYANTVTLTVKTAVSLSTSKVDLSCNAVCTGSITATPSGGNGSPWTYSWATIGSTTSVVNSLCTGTYTVTVLDKNSCSATTTATITQPTALTYTASNTHVNCFGVCSATGTLTASGGTVPYSYSWGTIGSTTSAVASVCAGTYTVTVADANTCSATTTITVTQPTALAANPSSTNVMCTSLANGTASVNPSGGTSPYTYLWSPLGSTVSTRSNLVPGSYSVTVTDSKTCSVMSVFTITEPTVIGATNSSITHISCNGACTGSGTISATGGTSPYTYSWSTIGSTASVANNLCVGTYSVTVTDANNCSTMISLTITQPTALSLSVNSATVTCSGSCNGTLRVTASGGTPTYNYLWTTIGSTTSAAANLCVGTYTVTVTDAGTCTAQATATVTNPTAISVSSTITHVKCNGNSTGSVVSTASGGTAPYTYLWATIGSTTSSIANLSAGTYTLTVTDAVSCTSTSTATVTQPTALVLTPVSANLSCSGACTGSASPGASGGTLPYTYLWNGGTTTSTISSLCASGYTVTVTDANTCTAQTSFIITQPTAIAVTVGSTNLVCNGVCNGTVSATGSGGTSPYTYLWAPGGSTASTASGLCAGTYSVTVTDANNCTIRQTVSITEPTALAANTSRTNVTCNGSCNGTALSAPSGGTSPYTYSWATIGSTTSSVSALCGGSTYTVTVTDANACTTTSSVAITQPTAISITLARTNLTCAANCNGSITSTVSGGTPTYTYLWATIGSTNAAPSSLCAGTYSVTVTDNALCTATSNITITSPPALTLSAASTATISCNGVCDGAAAATAGGGTSPYSYLWAAGGQTTSAISNLCLGTYTITLTDANACTSRTTVSITQPVVLSVSTSFTPPSCSGGNNGTATGSAAGGTSPYTYLWSAGAQTSSSISNLTTGTYSITVTDSHGCSVLGTVTITQPVVLSSSISSVNSTCGLCDGTAAITAAGGTIPYAYSWTTIPAQTTSAASALCVGGYTYTVTDANGCSATGNVTINQTVNITISSSANTLTCNGSCDGAATANAAGGTPPYSYAWSTVGSTVSSISNLCAGTYTVTVTDINLCSNTASVTFTNPTAISLAAASTDITCNGAGNGTATATASGGTGALTYLWATGGQTTSAINSLSAGGYTITVRDANNCSNVASVTVTEPLAIVPNTTSNSPTCGVNNGDIALSPTGGNGTYTYLWSPGGQTTSTRSALGAGTYSVTVTSGGCASQFIIPLSNNTFTLTTAQTNINCSGSCNGSATVTVAGGTSPLVYSWSVVGSTTTAVSNLCANNYIFTVVDANNCTGNTAITITAAPALSATSNKTDPDCNGDCNGTASISVSGGTPAYTYNWATIGSTTSAINNLCAGTYTVVIGDAVVGCTSSQTVTLNNPTVLTVSTSSSNITCNGSANGSAGATGGGGTPAYSYNWSSGQSIANITSLTPGNYTITVLDANACTATTSITITQPTVLSLTKASTDISCFGAGDGTGTVTASGGTPAYTYNWSPIAQTTSSIANLNAGTYDITVTDANNCSNTQSVTITEPNVVTPNVSNTPVLCNGSCNGTATASPTGGTAPYSFVWSSGQTTSSISGLCMGSYTVTVTDANGCLGVQVTTVTQPTILLANVTGTDATCSGTCNGSALTNPIGGTSPYTYNWNSGATTSSVTSLCAGTYTITVRDANSCSDVQTVTITNPSAISIASSTTPSNCTGACIGTIDVVPAGGTPNYTYLWASIGSTTSSLSSLCVGTYTVAVTDANACSGTLVVAVNAINAPVVVVSSQTDVTCFASCNGAATVSVSAGTPGYTYLWSAVGSVTSAANNLCSGNYIVTVTDVNSCSVFTSVTITEPTAITDNATVNNSQCSGVCNGSISLNPSGGTGAYSYVWAPGGQTTSAISNLCAAVYTVTVSDANNCSYSFTYLITPNVVLTASMTGTDPLCNGGCTGTAVGSISSGTAPYTYLWAVIGSTTSNISSLCPGTYSLTITDANGCNTTQPVTISQPPAITVTPTAIDANCGVCNGSITLTSVGGASPYTYVWNTSNTGSTLGSACAAVYSYTVTDANSCSNSGLAPLNNIGGPSTFNSTIINETCFGSGDGSVSITPVGGTAPYTYNWVPGGILGNSRSNLSAGTYSLQITDANGCLINGTVTITSPNQISDGAVSINATCGACDGSITLNPSGGTSPYTYLWTSGQTGSVISALCAATYTVAITDNAGCTQASVIAVNNATAPSIIYTVGNVSCNGGADGSISATAIGGVSPYTYSWSNGATNSFVSNLQAGTYNLTVTDASSCISIVSIVVTEPNGMNVIVSNVTVPVCGQCNGAATLNVLGGSSPYTYLWNTGNSTSNANSLCGGSYTVTITDGTGCSLAYTFPLNNANGPTNANISVVQETCSGTCDGSATISPVGGVAPYTFNWNPQGPTNNGTMNNLCAATYPVQIIDGNGCVYNTSVSITGPTPITANELVTPPSACGVCDGAIIVNPSGGTAPYTYLWSPSGQTTSSISNLCANIYPITITDANGCTGITAIPVTNNTGPTLFTFATNNTCYGGANGTATVSASGGTPPYTYNWSGGQATSVISNLTAGVYTVTVTDASSCVSIATATVTDPSQVIINLSNVTLPTCGNCNGALTVQASGGIGPYSYLWNTGQSTSNISALCGGVYNLVLTDGNGCQAPYSVPVSNSTGPNSATVTTTGETCYGSCNGSASLSVSGGILPYSYNWVTITNTTSAASGLCQGSYNVQVSDANNCVYIASVTITGPSQIVGNELIANPTCGNANGVVLLTPSGGKSPYTYLWTNGTTKNSLVNIAAGSYSVTITDASSCNQQITINVSTSNAPTLSFNELNPPCGGTCNGSAFVSATGGNPAYTYDWSGGLTTSAISNLCPGAYNVTVTDASSCAAVGAVTITSPPVLSFISNSNDVKCSGACDGTGVALTNGGVLPYSVVWTGVSGSTSGANATGLCVGNYTVTVIDANGCSPIPQLITISEPSPLAISHTTTPTACSSATNGSITLSVSGGTLPYSYQWSGASTATTSGLSNIGAGSYTVTVTDAHGCSIMDTAVVVASPNTMAVTHTTTPVSCSSAMNGAITLSVSGGTNPYTYQWSGASSGTTSGLINIGIGNYSVTVTDVYGCSVSDTAVVVASPNTMAVTHSTTPVSCSSSKDGAITLSVSGGTNPYVYQWSGSSSATTSNLSNIGIGSYSVTVTDVYGCTAKDTAIVNATIFVDAKAGNDTLFCDKAIATLKGNKSTGALTYQWFELPAMTPVGTTANITVNPPSGSTKYMLIAQNGVCFDIDTVQVTSIALPDANAGADQTILKGYTATLGGSPTTTISNAKIVWNPGETLNDSTIANPVASPTVTTLYIVTVTNSSGCSYSDTVKIKVMPEIVPPGGLTPNGDGKNDKWIISNIELFPNCVVEVYNRWGQLMFSSTGYVEAWDGTFQGSPLPVGTYYYIVRLNHPLYPNAITGPVTIMR